VIAIRKLMSLSPGHRARKAAQTLEVIERAYRGGDFSSARWVQELVAALVAETNLKAGSNLVAETSSPADSSRAVELHTLLTPILPESLKAPLSDPQDGIRLVNRLRRSLEVLAGGAPADWDFLEPLGLTLDSAARSVFSGMRAYLEDVRSPFNVGSMFRTSDAFGLAEILLSGFSADPAHPRAERAAMGCTSLVPWRRVDLGGLEGLGEVFALELRGEPIDSFEFPERGVVIVGSEELGVSPEALERCSRRVSIPMLGAKGSLNVGVAFGVLLDAWRRNLQCRGIAALSPGHSD
jgi:RNA methyltransferase, TrmH family